jgi:cytochrome c peroxidase
MLSGLILGLGCGDSRSAPETARPDTSDTGAWTTAEIALLESISIQAIPSPPPSPSNRVADNPVAAKLGQYLFFDSGLSRDGSVSCASCHNAALLFTDGRTTSRGLADTSRNAPTIMVSAHSPWQFWDGRRDSLWAQALAPMETAAEMGTTRLAVVRHIVADPRLAELYERVFGSVPVLDDAARFPERGGPFGDQQEQDAWYRMSAADRKTIDIAFANVGKAIAAYERRIGPSPSRFDRWVGGLRTGRTTGPEARLSEEEVAGLRLFIDSARTSCLRCHNGPLLTNHVFHDIGTALGDGRLPDLGRFLGLQAVLVDPFNCLGSYSDALPKDCRELRFLDTRHTEAEIGKFKTPTLRGLPRTGPYMHDGRFTTLEQVVDHYRFPPTGPDTLEITPLEINDAEAKTLAVFLRSLDSGVDVDAIWLGPPGSGRSSMR